MGESRWTVVIAVKRLVTAKSRLRGAVSPWAHEDLALALALDTVTAAVACPQVLRVLVVTADPLAAPALTRAGARIVAEPTGGGLNAAFLAGARCAAGGWVAALTADLPALRPAELAAALTSAAARTAGTHVDEPAGRTRGTQPDPAAGGRAFVADAPGTGTVLLTAAPGQPLAPRFGPDSAAAHAGSGARPLHGRWPSLRRDVDTAGDLAEAIRLGLGRHSAAVLAAYASVGADRYGAGMQGTVATFDSQTRGGTLLLDDGRRISFPPAAFDASGLRLLRLGQRVRVEHDDAGQVCRITLLTLG